MSDTKRKRYDKNTPEARELTDQIVHGTFMKEGTMVAFPMCFPGATVPISADESRITTLTTGNDGMIYGGTSGRAAHVFVAMFHGVTGAVFDRGTIAGANQCTAIACGRTKFVACANGPEGGHVVMGKVERLPFDLIQEWGFNRPPLEDLGQVHGEPVLHGTPTGSGELMVGLTTGHLFAVDIEKDKIETLEELPGKGQLAVGSRGGIFGFDAPQHLWRYDLASRKLERRAVVLPTGAWEKAPFTWARETSEGRLYVMDSDGRLFSFDETRGFSSLLARTPLTPAGPSAVTHDGRLFGFCGSGMANMFCYTPETRDLKNLGVAVSVLERRRYGYMFGAAVTGRDGQIVFGEDDDLGHLWLYFPSIRERRSA
jgi:hypothetical protein